MPNSQPSSNNNIVNYNQEYKKCAYRECNGRGIYPLKIVLLNIIGFFCLVHSHELLSLELVVET
jgi:hypothetical protein